MQCGKTVPWHKLQVTLLPEGDFQEVQTGSDQNNNLPGRTPQRTPRNPGHNVGHYMPRQGLFEGEHVLDLLGHYSSEEEEASHMQFYSNRNGVTTPVPNQSFDSCDIMNDGPPHTEGYDRTSSLAPKEPSVNFVALFQEQQAMLQCILKQQETMQKQQEQIIEKQKTFEERVIHLEESEVSESSGGSCKRKSRVTRQLTVSFVAQIV